MSAQSTYRIIGPFEPDVVKSNVCVAVSGAHSSLNERAVSSHDTNVTVPLYQRQSITLCVAARSSNRMPGAYSRAVASLLVVVAFVRSKNTPEVSVPVRT